MANMAVLKQAVGDLDEAQVMELLDTFIAGSPTEDQTQEVVMACQQGMEIVGDLYDKGEYFVGDLIFAGELLTSCIDKLKPYLGSGVTEVKGVIVLGTVEGDIHDIGKNIFRSMAEAGGFQVIDLGIDIPADKFVQAIKENKPQVVAMSGVLTLSIDSMKKTVEAIKAEGLRDGIKITIGGNAVSAQACEYVGADAWSKNAAETVKVCGGWVS